MQAAPTWGGRLKDAGPPGVPLEGMHQAGIAAGLRPGALHVLQHILHGLSQVDVSRRQGILQQGCSPCQYRGDGVQADEAKTPWQDSLSAAKADHRTSHGVLQQVYVYRGEGQ